MLLHKSIERDSRVRREAKALQRGGHEVTVVHLPSTPGKLEGELDGFQVVSATPPAWVRRALPFHLYRLVFLLFFIRAVLRPRPDVVHAHDAAMLVPGWLAARRARASLVYDTHEYAPGVPYRERLWEWFVNAVERTFIGRCDAVITVSDGIADRLVERYGLEERPTVVRNIPDLEMYDESFEAPDLRTELGMGTAEPLVVHLGAVAGSRGCETLIRAMAEVDTSAELLFLGADDARYVQDLRRLARDVGVSDIVHFRPSVPIERVLAFTRQASVGVSLLEGNCENHRLALPNKVFEYLAAGVPVVVSDLPELRRVIQEGGHGVSADPKSSTAVSSALDSVLSGVRDPVVPRSETQFDWAQESARLIALYRAEVGRASLRSKALVLVRNTCTYDARVHREARLLLRLGYETQVVGVVSTAEGSTAARIDGVDVERLRPTSPFAGLRAALTRRGSPPRSALDADPQQPRSPGRRSPLRTVHRFLVTLDYYRLAIRLVRRTRPDLVHCNDYNTMWVGAAAKVLGSRVVYDAHELWPDRNLRPEPRSWLMLCEALFVRIADRTITTSPGYAAAMAARYRINPPLLVRNVPEVGFNGGSPTAPDQTVAVYYGAVTRGRGLETAIAALNELPAVRLRIVGPDAWGYRKDLESFAEREGVRARVEFHPPVPPAEGGVILSTASVGLALIEPVCSSYRLTLPNKLFEYVAAGVPILASDLPVIAQFVGDHGVGLTVSPTSASEVAAALERLLEPEANAAFRAATVRAAEATSWETESQNLAEAYAAAADNGVRSS